MPRIADEDLRLRTVYEPAQDTVPDLDVVAVHGTAAHPDHTWAKLKQDGLDVRDPDNYVSWIRDAPFLPTVTPTARIMRYGYRSGWYGDERVKISTMEIAVRLLSALVEERQGAPTRPLVFIAHSFGGLVVIRCLVEAINDRTRWTSIYDSCTGLMFFGTPFRGSDRHDQAELLAMAERRYGEGGVYTDNMRVLIAGNEALDDLMRRFHASMAVATARPLMLCFYEQQHTNIAAVVDREEHLMSYWVNKDSGSLDLGKTWPRNCNHLEINKFRAPTDEDFSEVRRFFDDIREQSATIIAARERASTGRSRGMPVPTTVCQHFKTRPEISSRLRDFWIESETRPTRAAIWGLGGAGKTQIALEFAHLVKQDAALFWIRGDQAEHFISDIQSIAKHLCRQDVPGESPGAVLARCKRAFDDMQERIVLIVDNVDDAELFLDSTPDGLHLANVLPDKGLVLMTTRDQAVVGTVVPASHGLHIDMMGRDVALSLLESSVACKIRDEAGNPMSQAIWLLDHLGNLPLAIAQCAATIRADALTLAEFIEIYGCTADRAVIMSRRVRELNNYPPAILTTWEVTYDRIQKRDQRAAHLIMTLGNLHWSGVPTSLLKRLQCVHGLSAYALKQVLAVLIKYCVIEKRRLSEDLEEIHMHPLVHFWLQQRETAGQALAHLSDALGLMASVFDLTHYENRVFNAYLLPHALEVLTRCDDLHLTVPYTARLLQTVSQHLTERGYHDSALKMIFAAERMSEIVWPERSPSRYLIQKYKAQALCASGKYSEAASAFQVAYEQLEAIDNQNDEIEEETEKLIILQKYVTVLDYAGRDDVHNDIFRYLESVDTSSTPVIQLHNVSFAMMHRGNYTLMEKFSDAAWEKLNAGAQVNERQLLSMKNARAILLCRKGQHAEALEIFQAVLDRSFEIMERSELDLWINANHTFPLLLDFHRFEEMAVYAARLFHEWDDSISGRELEKAAGIMGLLALSFLRRGVCAEARECWGMAIEWDRSARRKFASRDRSIYTYNIGVSFVQEGNWEAAVDFRAGHVEAFEQEEPVYGTLEIRRGRFEHGRKLWEEMRRASPKDRTRIQGAWTSEEQTDYQRAVWIHGAVDDSQPGSDALLLDAPEQPETPPQTGLERYFEHALTFPPFL